MDQVAHALFFARIGLLDDLLGDATAQRLDLQIIEQRNIRRDAGDEGKLAQDAPAEGMECADLRLLKTICQAE